MFKPKLWQSHTEYRTIVNTYGCKLSRNYSKYSFGLYDIERQKLLNLNLDAILEFILPFYSPGGRPAKNQTQILRPLILFVLLFNRTPARTSLTAWVKDVLPASISLTVLVGCTCKEELPPLGSYYDFMNRFWMDSTVMPSSRKAGIAKSLIKPSVLTASWKMTLLFPARKSYLTS